MIQIDEEFVDAAAPNSNAVKNGRSLLVKGKFVSLKISPDDTLIFGECSGSGSSNYACSCDFVALANPVYRCSCPSRQFPCKHCLGLMYAFVDGKKFSKGAVPEDVESKREKVQVRAEKKKERSAQPKKVNKAALKKKVAAQLAGLDLLEQLTHDLVRAGMGNMNAKLAGKMEAQAKQLGNAYLPGAQAAIHGYTRLFVEDDGYFDAEISAKAREVIYSEAMDQLSRLSALVKHGRKYLSERLDDPALAPETDTPIAAWLGHAWQLSELSAAGLVQNDVELIQLAFNSYDDTARREYIETGIWMNLATGAIQQTQNFRPYKAASYIKSEDSFFKIAQVPELAIYPGKVNPRIRWDGSTSRPVAPEDLVAVRKNGRRDFAAVAKEVKAGLKSPLANKWPVVALSYAKLAEVAGDLVIEDEKEQRLVFTEHGVSEEPASCHLLRMLPSVMHKDQTMVVRFHHDLDSRTLKVKPLSIVTNNQVFRLTL